MIDNIMKTQIFTLNAIEGHISSPLKIKKKKQRKSWK